MHPCTTHNYSKRLTNTQTDGETLRQRHGPINQQIIYKHMHACTTHARMRTCTHIHPSARAHSLAHFYTHTHTHDTHTHKHTHTHTTRTHTHKQVRGGRHVWCVPAQQPQRDWRHCVRWRPCKQWRRRRRRRSGRSPGSSEPVPRRWVGGWVSVWVLGECGVGVWRALDRWVVGSKSHSDHCCEQIGRQPPSSAVPRCRRWHGGAVRFSLRRAPEKRAGCNLCATLCPCKGGSVSCKDGRQACR